MKACWRKMAGWRWIVPTLLACMLVACGGGGGGGGDPAGGTPPTLTVQPASASVTGGVATSFSVTATGSDLSYQWQRSVDNGASWQAIAAATSSSYGIAAVDVSMNGQQFRVVVTAAGVSVTSSAALLSVMPAAVAPTISTQPQDASVDPSAQVSFSVVAAGTPTPGYQWQLSTDGGVTFVNIDGATASSYVFAAALPDSGHIYRVVVSNSAGSVTSRASTLVVKPPTVQRFAYVENFNSWNISAYAISQTSGALSPVSGSPYRPLSSPLLNGLTLHPSGKFLYESLSTGLKGGVFGYSVDSVTGQLAALSASTLTSGASVGRPTIHSSGNFMYLPHDLTGGIEGYTVDTSTGAVHIMPGSPFATGSSGASEIVIDPTGNYLYELEVDTSDYRYTASLHALRIDPNSGALAPVAGSPFALPSALYALPITHPGGGFVYAISYTNQLTAFAVQPGTGALMQVPGSPYTVSSRSSNSGAAPAFDPRGKFIYFDVGATGSSRRTVYGYAIDQGSGALSAIAGNPFGADFGAGYTSCGLANAGGSGFLLQGGPGMAALKIDTSSGALSVSDQKSVTLGGGCMVAMEPSGSFAYVGGAYGFSGFRFAPGSGTLTPISSGPWSTPGGSPRSIVFR